MPQLYNRDAYPLVPRPGVAAVEPGDPADFSDEEIARGIAGNWSKENPYAPLAAPPKRKAKTTRLKPENDEEE